MWVFVRQNYPRLDIARRYVEESLKYMAHTILTARSIFFAFMYSMRYNLRKKKKNRYIHVYIRKIIILCNHSFCCSYEIISKLRF